MIKISLADENAPCNAGISKIVYYQQRALGHSTEFAGKLILKIDSLPADKKAIFSAEEIYLMRTTLNQLRNERLAKGQYTDAVDDMMLKLF